MYIRTKILIFINKIKFIFIECVKYSSNVEPHHPSVFNEIFRLRGKINYREISFHETGNVNTIPWTKDIFSSQFYYFFRVH